MWDSREMDSLWVWLEPGVSQGRRLEGGMAEFPMDLLEKIRLHPGGVSWEILKGFKQGCDLVGPL